MPFGPSRRQGAEVQITPPLIYCCANQFFSCLAFSVGSTVNRWLFCSESSACQASEAIVIFAIFMFAADTPRTFPVLLSGKTRFFDTCLYKRVDYNRVVFRFQTVFVRSEGVATIT